MNVEISWRVGGHYFSHLITSMMILEEFYSIAISLNKLSFFEILVVAYIDNALLELDAWYRGSHFRELYISIDFHS